MPPLLEVRDLHKHYGSLKAVDGISFTIAEGICFGLLGPNGAGKSTTIEMIEGIKTPTSGDILYRGEPRGADFPQCCGIQFQSTALQDHLTVAEVLNLFGNLYRQTLPQTELTRLCDIADLLDRPANKLSGGQRQRLLLALALINDPEIIFLDEPTTGLDPQSRRHFWELIKTIKSQGKTVVLTTHYMDEAEILCDQLVIVDHGHIIAEGTPAALLEEHLPYRQIRLPTGSITPDQFQGPLSQQAGQSVIETRDVESTLQALIGAGVELSGLQVRNPTLEDLFIKLTGHALRE